MGVNFIKKYQNLVISNSGKSPNKVGVTVEIGCKKDPVLSKDARTKVLFRTKMRGQRYSFFIECADVKWTKVQCIGFETHCGHNDANKNPI